MFAGLSCYGVEGRSLAGLMLPGCEIPILANQQLCFGIWNKIGCNPFGPEHVH
jgi:hypothetical protein